MNNRKKLKDNRKMGGRDVSSFFVIVKEIVVFGVGKIIMELGEL